MIFSGFKIIFNSFSYGTDKIILDSENMFNSWIAIGRFFLVLLTRLFGLYGNINIRVINIITYINVFIYFAFFIKFLNIDKKSNSILKDILCAIIVITSPILLDQYNFTLQSVEVSFTMILMMISFITTYIYLKDRKKLFLITTIILLIFCFGVYQSFINLYVVGALICLIKLNNESKKNISNI